MKEIGIKLADGSFYPIMEDGVPCKKNLVLTTVKDNQTRVIVDVYRTKNRSLIDAEYIDSLQIDGLVPHPNGEVELSLNIGLDERNKLWATMNDPETGETTDANVTLVSRTLEERLEPTNYEVVDSADVPEDEKTIAEDENPSFEVAEESDDIGPEIDGDFDIPDSLTDEEINVPSDDLLDEEEVKTPTEKNDNVGRATAALAGVAGIGLLAKAEKVNSEDTEKKDAVPSEDDHIEVNEEPVFEETVPEVDSNVDDDPFGDSLDLDLPNFTDDDMDTEEVSEETPDAIETESAAIEPVEEEPQADGFAETTADDSIDDPFGSDILPDMSIPLEEDNGVSESDDIFNDDDFDMPELDDNALENTESSTNDGEVKSPTVGGIDFGGLYDKETENGNSSYDEDEEMSKKTRVPVVICVVCAIICLLATTLILFVVPSKYNLFNKNAENKKEPAVIEKETEEIEEDTDEDSEASDIFEDYEEEFADEEISEEEPSTEAKEDEVVVVTEPEIVETVVPEPAPEPEQKPADIVYKIKWGDTLWDISEAYYKTPWKYPKIARYNNIRDPDYIISGTTISIPAE